MRAWLDPFIDPGCEDIDIDALQEITRVCAEWGNAVTANGVLDAEERNAETPKWDADNAYELGDDLGIDDDDD